MSLSAARLRAVPLLAASILLAGCGTSSGASSSDKQAVAAFFPLAWVTERVAGDEWEVTNLTQPGVEPHDLSLGIGETADLDDATLVVFEHEFQPQIDDAIENISGATLIDAAEVVELRSLEDSEEEHDEESAEEGHGDTDPHFWQDPLLMADLADAIADGLAEVDPDGAARYRDNADEVRTDLEALDADFSAGLADCERDTVVVSHEAFGYLERYGLRFEGIAGLSPDAEPTPAVLAELEDLIAAEGITTVFSERLASPAMAESLASDAGVETAVLDPLEGPGKDSANDPANDSANDSANDQDAGDYVALMQQNLAVLQAANGC